MKLSRKGFTLIELLAVIVIIAIIALIGIPSVTRIIDNSRKDAFKSTALSMASAARNVIASDNITVTETGCSIGWTQLNMESNVVSGGTVTAANSFVNATADASGNITYVINLEAVNGTTYTYIDGGTKEVLQSTTGRASVMSGAAPITYTTTAKTACS